MNETYSIDLPDFVFEESEEKRVKSTIAGRVISIVKCEGDYVGSNEEIVMIESMKMEVGYSASVQGKIFKIFVHEGDKVSVGQELFEILSDEKMVL